jgi:putative methyltransferase
MTRPVNVLISVPNNNPKHVVYLPTIWANLKTHGDRLPGVGDRAHWLEPIIFKGTPEALLAPYADTPIDVLGLSCYSWNTNTNLALAAEVRTRHPDCLIVAGGPHIDYRYQDFFGLHPAVDALVLRDGEIPFGRALEQVVQGEIDLGTIPGLVRPASRQQRLFGTTYLTTSAPELPATFDHSPWLENAAYFEQLMARLRTEQPRRPVGIPWETDRGCPYTCSFCDWGSNTHSRVRALPLERLHEEALWIARNRIHVNFMTVANFGSAPRDEAILDYIIEAKALYGFPRVFIWNNAKNNVDRVVAMNEKAFQAGIIDYHILSVQSLDDEVLAAMGRNQIDKRQLLDVVRIVSDKHIPCVAQLIFGGPADTREKFVRSMTGLMEVGVHDEYIAYPFDVLPNAPANAPEYRERWGVRTVTRRGQVNRRDPKLDEYDQSTIIVGTHSHDEREFVDMYVWGRLIIALHNSGVTQHISRYLRRTHDVAFYDFYTTVIEELFVSPDGPWHGVYQRCHDHIAAFIGEGGEYRVESMPLEELPDFDYLFNVEEYLLCKLMLGLHAFYDDLQALVLARFGPLPLLSSLRGYQQGIIIDPGYDRRSGRTLTLRHDWPAYFAEDATTAEEPDERRASILITRTHSGTQQQYALDWFEKTDAIAPFQHWVQTVVGKHYQRSERAYFKDIGKATRHHAAPLTDALVEDGALRSMTL